MRRLRTLSTRRLAMIVTAVAVLAATAGIAQATLGSDPRPAPKALDRAVYDALNAPAVEGITARVTFTNGLLPAGSLPGGGAGPLAAGADGRAWIAGDGRFRLELQSEQGDAQIVSDGERLTVSDTASRTVYTLPLPDEREGARDHERPTLEGVRRGLDRLARAWTLSGAEPTSTAGRPSYTVRIAPKDDGGLLGAGELAWDADRGVPLRAAVYAQGQAEPVLEVEVTDIAYGEVAASDLRAEPPADARVVRIDPRTVDASGRPTAPVRGVEAVQARLDFPLSAPDELAGLPRRQVRLVEFDGTAGAVSTYGEGLGGIVVLQRKAGGEEPDSGPGDGDVQLPRINIDGATGTELATALGTMVTFERGGVAYTVLGSVPPVAAENAARGLR